jgi:uncharacterized protein (DUF433 family)
MALPDTDVLDQLPLTELDDPAAEMAASPRTVIHSDPEILSGTPVFVGTRVPVDNLFDYLEAGDGLDRFLDHFPTVRPVQAVAALKVAREMLRQAARARDPR